VLVCDVGPGVESEASRTITAQDPPFGTVTSNESTVTISAPPLRQVVVAGSNEVTHSAKVADTWCA